MSSLLRANQPMAELRRWELDNFDPAARRAVPRDAQLPTAAQLEQLHQQAHAEGHAAGLAEGRAAAAQAAAHLQALVAEFEQARQALDQQLAEELLALSTEIARRVVCETLRLRPETVLEVIRDALRELPSAHGQLILMLHPEDAKLAREHLAERFARPDWKIVEDPGLARGGCRLETGGGEIDATMPTRWQRVLAALGRSDAWLA